MALNLNREVPLPDSKFTDLGATALNLNIWNSRAAFGQLFVFGVLSPLTAIAG